MIPRLRPAVAVAVLTAALLTTLIAPGVDARMPRPRHYHAGGAITLDTNLLSKSGASVWAIDEYLRATTPLPALGAAFLKAERKYKVNARFLLAAALHESGWGTSYISRTKHNLFGYNAYDRDPVRYATAFATYAANIDATARFIHDFYLTPGGRWWGGAPTLRSMQQCWSSSGRWGEGVSRIASSIRLDSITRRSIRFTAPAVSGTLHGGSQVRARLSWKGGAIPKGIEYVARWVPVDLDAVSAREPAATTTVPARRVKVGARSLTLAATAPRAPGTYLLVLELRDAGRRPLPARDQVDIPGVEVRVWGDRAVSYELVPSGDGVAPIVRITNTGRETIPAGASAVASGPTNPEDQPLRSLVALAASAGEPGNPEFAELMEVPLRADLPPGASFDIHVPTIGAATGRTTNWLSINLGVLGDPSWLGATSRFGTWVSDAAPATPEPSPSASATPTATVPPARPAATAAPTPTPAPVATPKATAKPKATAAPSPTPAPVAKPKATAKPKAKGKPAPARVTTTYSEHSGAIRYRGGWATAGHAGYRGGHAAWARSAGASATFSFTGSSVSWVGPKGPTRGTALVILDGSAVVRVSMWRSTFLARTVLFKRSFHANGRHTLTIKVLSTPGHPVVAIDGFIVRS